MVHDQLCAKPLELSFLPMAQHPALVQVLDAMQASRGDHRSLAEWAETVHMTERTLARHCQRELGMSLGEWLQRMRYLTAIDALEAGHTVQHPLRPGLQHAVGLYCHASALIRPAARAFSARVLCKLFVNAG